MLGALNQLLNDDKEINIINDRFVISRNLLEFYDRFIQISNVTSIVLVDANKKIIDKKYYLFILVSIVACFINPIIGLLLLGFCGYMIYQIFQYNSSLGKNVYINLSSGQYLFIRFKEEAFAREVVDILKKQISHPNNQSVSVSVENSTVSFGDHSPIEVGVTKDE